MTANHATADAAAGHIDDWYDVPKDEALGDDGIVDYLAQMNDWEDPDEGMVSHRVRRFASFQRQMVELSWFRDDGWDQSFSPSLAKAYAEDRAGNAPPIVVDGVERSVIDGFHRLNAARMRGDKHILAYVGTDPRPEWEPYEEPQPMSGLTP